MVRSFRYILRRILIGTGIALLLGLIRGKLLLNTYALEVSPYVLPETPIGVITNQDISYSYNVVDNFLPFSAHAGTSGYINFTFAVFKVSGTSTAAIAMPRGVSVSFGNGNISTNFTCSIGSASANNSTFNSQVYSARCPVNANSNGLTQIYIAFQDFQANDNSTYRVVINRGISYEIMENTNVNVNVDNSSVSNSINNQISNDNQNTQSIINNQDSNTQDMINSQKSCKVLDKNDTVFKGFLNNNGTINSSSSTAMVSDYINISDKYTLKVLIHSDTGVRGCFYSSSKSFISCFSNSSLSDNQFIDIPSNARFFRFAINYTTNIPTYELCANGNQAIVDSQQAINNTLNDSSSVPDSEISSLFNDLNSESSNTPISDLLTMPITLIQAYITGFSSSCSSVNLGNLYGTDLILPCIQPQRYLGSNLWSLIDTLFSIYMVYNIAMLCISIYEGITSLQDEYHDLYGWEGGKHAAVSRSQRWEAD